MCVCSTEWLVLMWGGLLCLQASRLELTCFPGRFSLGSVLKHDPFSPVPCHSTAVCLWLLPARGRVSHNRGVGFCDHLITLKKSRSACSWLLFGDKDGRGRQKSTDK